MPTDQNDWSGIDHVEQTGGPGDALGDSWSCWSPATPSTGVLAFPEPLSSRDVGSDDWFGKYSKHLCLSPDIPRPAHLGGPHNPRALSITEPGYSVTA